MGTVSAYTEPDRPGPEPTGRGPTSSTEGDMIATGLLQRMHLPGLLKVEQATRFHGDQPERCLPGGCYGGPAVGAL